MERRRRDPVLSRQVPEGARRLHLQDDGPDLIVTKPGFRHNRFAAYVSGTSREEI